MVKRINLRIKEGGVVRCFPVSVGVGTTAAGILSLWGLNEYFLEDPVTNLIYPRRSDLFPLVRDGMILEVIHESMVDI